ncbi:rho GTPase-activating protein 7 isoform X1 [Petromyzon marinus]|uniref:rho GTPase-activating protein 7 isoform X1 n=1 Tax=Petromyzon marinus TaxID=7757 RepID=UPI003F70C533
MRPGDHMFSSHDAPCCRGYAGGAARADLAKVAAILSGSDVVGPTNGAEFTRARVDTPASRSRRLPDAAWPLDFQGGEDLLNDRGTAVVSVASAGGEAPTGPGGEAPLKGNYCSLSASTTSRHSGHPSWQKCHDQPDDAAIPVDEVPDLAVNADNVAVTANGRHELHGNHSGPDLPTEGAGLITTDDGQAFELIAKSAAGTTSPDPEEEGDNDSCSLPVSMGGVILPSIDAEKDPDVTAEFDVTSPTPSACTTETSIDSGAQGEASGALLQTDEPGSSLAPSVSQLFCLDTIPEEARSEGSERIFGGHHEAGMDEGDHIAEALSLVELGDEAEIVHTGVVARKRRRNDRSKTAATPRPLDDGAGSPPAPTKSDATARKERPLPDMTGYSDDFMTDAALAGAHCGGAECPGGIKSARESDVLGGGGGPRLPAQSPPPPAAVVVWSSGDSDAESKTNDRALRIVEEPVQLEPGPSEQHAAAVARRAEMSSAGRGYPRIDSLTALMLKLAQLDLEVGAPLGLSGPSSSSSTPTNTPKRRHCSVESEMDTTLTPGPQGERQGLPPGGGAPAPMPSNASLAEASGARPKAPVLAVRLYKEKAELEAKEACDWLRAAGFPQYAQLYEDSQFPISIRSVVKDHDFLDSDSIEALCRRLNTLNNCASMKLDRGSPRKRSEDSDDEDLCAISDKWMFQRASRRWSRLEDFEVFSQNSLSSDVSCSESGHLKDSSPSHESLLTDLSEQQEVTSIHSESSSSNNGLLDDCRFGHQGGPGAGVAAGVHPSKWPSEAADAAQVLKDATNHPVLAFTLSAPTPAADKPQPRSRTKSLLKRMENFRAKGHSHKRRVSGGKVEGLVISGPVSLQGGPTEETLRRLNCVDIAEAKSAGVARDRSQSESSFLIHSPGGCGSGTGGNGNGTAQLPTRSSSYVAGQSGSARGRGASSKRGGMYLGDFDALTGHLCDGDEDPAARPPRSPKDVVIHLPKDHKPGTFPRTLSNESLATSDSFSSVTWRTGSFNSGSRASCEGGAGADEQQQPKRGERRRRTNSCSSMASRLSVYDNVPASQLLLLAAAGDLSSSGAEDGDGDAGNNGRVFSQLDDILQQVNGLQEMVSRWTERLSPDEPEDSDSARDSTCNSPASSPHQHMELDGDAYNSTSGRTTPPSDLESTGTSLIDSEDSGIQDRRESSTGQSVARPNRRQRLRWHSFQTSHRPSLNSASLQINSQSVAQMSLVRKFSLLRLTALMERYSPSNKQGWNWGVPKFMRRMRTPDYKDRSVFGVPLLLNVQRTGQPLPQSIQQAMRYLRSQCLDQVGLFRKSGVKSRIQALREMNESGAESVNYEGQSAYDVADMLKQYFRDLPEPMFTSKLADTFLQIYQYVPKEQQLQALQAGTMLLPDENREALQTLLYFLSDVAAAVGENQMSSVNLAVCLAPSLFHLNTVKRDNSTSRVRQRKYSTGKPDQKDLSENLAAIQGLAHMIAECKKLFKIPEEMVSQCRSSYMEHDTQPMSLAELGAPVTNGGGPPPASPSHRSTSQSSVLGPEELRSSSTSSISRPDYQAHLESCIQGLLKEARDKFKGWVTCSSLESSTEVAYKKVGDGHLLRLWKTTVEVEAPPPRVLQRIRSERHLWDEDLLQWKVVETLDPNTEVFYYVLNSMAPHPARDYLVLRSWRTDLPKGSCVLVATSVEHEEVPCVGEARAVVLASRYLIEPLGANRSRLTHVCRIDTRGRSLEWYNKVFGHLCASKVAMIRDSFKKPKTDFPETKV